MVLSFTRALSRRETLGKEGRRPVSEVIKQWEEFAGQLRRMREDHRCGLKTFWRKS